MGGEAYVGRSVCRLGALRLGVSTRAVLRLGVSTRALMLPRILRPRGRADLRDSRGGGILLLGGPWLLAWEAAAAGCGCGSWLRLGRLRVRLGRLLLLAAAGEAAAGEAAAGEVPGFAETGRCWFDQEFS